MSDCPICGDHLHVNEEWVLREGLTPDGDAKEGDYVHKRCQNND